MLRDVQILNSQLVAALSSAGHTQLVVVADPGLPIPPGVPVVDLSLVPGVPSLRVTLEAVMRSLIVESAVAANEIRGSDIADVMHASLGNTPLEFVSHEQLKALLAGAHVVVRTGECTPYANVVLVAGAGF